MKKVLTRDNCTKDEAIALTSRVSAWRLFSGKVDHLVVNYHKRSRNVDLSNIEFNISECYRIAAHSVKKLIDTQHFYFDDIVSEAVTRFLETCGNEGQGSAARLWSLAKYTAFDFMKRKLFQETELLTKEYYHERLST